MNAHQPIANPLRAASVLLAASAAIAAFPPAHVFAQERPRRPSGPWVAPVESPDVSTEGKTVFRLRAPEAGSVRLTGSDMPPVGQGLDMAAAEEGLWEAEVGPVEPGAYRYRFEVDGVPVIDPVNPQTSESNGNAWSLVYVPGAEWMDTLKVPHGAVAEVTYYSESLERFRRMHVYTPPGYESGAERYPVFYLLHGAFDCDDSWTTVGRAGFILDNLIAQQKARPMVVVMPAGHTGPFDFRPGGGLPLDEFTRDFLGDVMPYVESHYRLLPGRENRAIAGLSMGGAQTLGIAVPNLEKFAYFGVFSSGVFGITGRPFGGQEGPSWEERNREHLDNPEVKKGLRLVWFATGKEDFLLDTSRATVEMLRKHGFEVVYEETPGGHTWTNWRLYLQDFAQKIF